MLNGNNVPTSACKGGCASISVRLAHALQKQQISRMNFKNLPIREGINIAGSLCSIFAVLMAFSITFNIAQWTVIIFGLVFGVCVFGLLLSCVRYIATKYPLLSTAYQNTFRFSDFLGNCYNYLPIYSVFPWYGGWGCCLRTFSHV